MKTTYAPIVIFAFNRLDALMASVESLKANSESCSSDLFVFVDAARKNKGGEEEKVERVRNFVKSITGFKSVHYDFAEENRGLGPSIIRGVTKVINEYGKAIVFEDDLIFSSNCLAFLNEGLNRYENDDKVFSICGYSNEVKVPTDYTADAYFAPRSSSWGWATWKDRWNSVDWELKDWNAVEASAKAFNRWGGSDCFGMLKDWKEGRNKSWAIRFCYAQFIQNKLALFPTISKIDNNGFDGQGTNCKKWSRFRCVFDKTSKNEFVLPVTTCLNNTIVKSALKYHTLKKRIWSKLMYIIYK